MKILLLEDNLIIANNIKQYLQIKMWWKVVHKDTIKKAEIEIENVYFDILLFDVMLPDGESYNLANKIKKDYDDLPIIFLTAKWDLEDKLQGFDAWWDDYITKPFELDELIARIHVIAKRFWITSVNIKWIDINLDNRKVSKDWVEIKLNKTEFLILDYLVSNRWRIIERTDMIDYI
jgi:DNA-binding response OmpR family regulator